LKILHVVEGEGWGLAILAHGRPRSDEVTGRIHGAVFALLEVSAYRDLSMEAVAKCAGVSRPSLYRRYASLGEAALGALLSVRSTTVPMQHTKDERADLHSYFRFVAAAISKRSTIGRALRGVLAAALTEETFKSDFARFIEARRGPVRQRLLQ
jgi:AcrR family transcriptional regulator